VTTMCISRTDFVDEVSLLQGREDIATGDDWPEPRVWAIACTFVGVHCHLHGIRGRLASVLAVARSMSL